jgi:hypothetical protein
VSSQSPVVGLRHEVHCYVVWLYTELRPVLRAVMTDFFFNCWCVEIPSDNVFGTNEGGSTIMLKSFDWKRSRISVF